MRQKNFHPWIVAAVTILTGIAFAASNNQATPALTTIMAYFDIGNGMAGGLITATTVVGVILALPGGGLCARYGARKLGILAVCCCLAGNILGAVAGTFIVLLIAQVIQGIGFAMSGIIGPSIILEAFPPEKRGLPMGLWSCYVGIGTMYIMNAANTVLDIETPSSWKRVWMLTIAVLAVILVLFWIFVRLPRQADSERPQAEKGQISLLSGLKNKRVWILAVIMFTYSFGVCVASSFLSNYCQTALKMPLADANSTVSIFSLGMIGGGVLSGILLNRCRNQYRFLLVASCAAAAAFTAVFLAPASALIPVLAVCGICVAFVPPTLFSLAGVEAASPQATGIVMGAIAFGNSLATVGTTVQGIVIDAAGWGAAAMVQCLMGIICVICAVLLLAGRKKASPIGSSRG